jgi:hypothetical protein
MVSQKRQLGPSHFICNGGSWLADQCYKSGMWVGGERIAESRTETRKKELFKSDGKY